MYYSPMNLPPIAIALIYPNLLQLHLILRLHLWYHGLPNIYDDK
jgi:hypothetical protein